jgi:hypothetical protein
MTTIESLRRRTYPVLHPIRTRPKHLAARLESLRVTLLAAGIPEDAHAWLDADDDTAWPLPGVAHPKTGGAA